MIAWSPIENKIRIPKKQRSMGEQSWQRGGFNMRRRPCSRATQGRQGDGAWRRSTRKRTCSQATPAGPTRSSSSPMGIERPHNSTVATSGFQTRLDHLTNRRALPACILPEGFERGVPIKECDGVQRHLLQQAHGQRAGGPRLGDGAVPVQRGRDCGRQVLGRARFLQGDRHQATRGRAGRAVGGVAPRPRQRGDAGRRWRAGGAAGRLSAAEPLALHRGGRGGGLCRAGGLAPPQRRAVLGAQRARKRAGVPRASGRGDQPDRRRVRPGGAGRASTPPRPWCRRCRTSGTSSAHVLTRSRWCETLHNDVQPYVQKVPQPSTTDVYERRGRRRTTLAGLPQITLRFPGVADTSQKRSGDVGRGEDEGARGRSACSVPLEQSRFLRRGDGT